MHVSACILLLPPLTIAALAFQFVYVCICTYIKYLYVYEVYARIVFVYACISCNHTSRHGKRCHVPEALSPGAAIGGPHSGHPWASGIHFFSLLADVALTRFGAPLPLHASRAPEAFLPLAAGRSPMHEPRTAIQSRDLSHQIW